ncbi:peptidase S8/S53 domain-containing protein [Stachybotrys elegans]|uniref:Peptidase S8/S53 domain-containing protein n=1 Tax=Stachybotrys elegans TaxID=80388 RepID=A0A8K0T280_9HYPO|nr:peptidase S8/S53 domain-containing protein [Stachybotrys elegans]
MDTSTPPVDAKPVTVNGQTFDPQDEYALDAARTNYITITAYSVLSIEQEDAVERCGARVMENLGLLVYLCYFEPTDLSALRALPFLRQVDVYRNKFKIPKAFEDSAEPAAFNISASALSDALDESLPEDICCVDVMVHEEAIQEMESIADAISTRTSIARGDMMVEQRKIRMDVSRALLPTIASDDRVRIIEEVVSCVLHDDAARAIVDADIQIEGISFRGNGQRIAVADTGLDNGDPKKCHPAFTGRVAGLIPIGRADQTNDPHGHGTHVCGVIVGQSFDTPKGNIGGIAPEAELVVQSLVQTSKALAIPATMDTLLVQPYETYKCRIFSNSWGEEWKKETAQLGYTGAAEEIDRFVWEHPDALVCFSAGNDGGPDRANGQPAIGGRAAARNCLTVGACGSTRIHGPGPNAKKQNFGSDEVLVTSNRGPTAERLIKPDVVAPGFLVYSAQSTAGPQYRDRINSTTNPGVAWMPLSGTSQATPMVAGCAAVLREILQLRGLKNPPSALLRCLIINGANKLPGIPCEAQGFGRVNLKASAAMIESRIIAKPVSGQTYPLLRGGGCLDGPPLRQSEIFECTLVPGDELLTSEMIRFKITLVWHDCKGSKVQNNLNLTIKIDDCVSYGNGASSEKPDVINNVEQIISKYSGGSIHVKVYAQNNLPQTAQPFALSWSLIRDAGESNP